MRGRGFWPYADGLFKRDGDGHERLISPAPLYFCGQDFGNQSRSGEYLRSIVEDDYFAEPMSGEDAVRTWVRIVPMLEAAEIDPTDGFFGDLLPGLRFCSKRDRKEHSI